MIPQNFENQKAHKQEDLKKTEYMPFRPAKKFLSLQARLLNAIEQSVIATDLDGIVIYWNRFAEQLYGWSAEEAIGRQIIKLTTPKPTVRQADEIMAELRQGKSWTGEFLVQRKDGATFPAQITNSPIYDNKQRLMGIVGLSSDISDRNRVEESLKQSEERLRNIFEASHDGILVENNETISYVNKSYVHLFGYDDAEELIGQHISCVISSEDVERVTEYGRSRLRGEQPPAKYEFKGKRKDGTSVDIEASVSTSKTVNNTYIMRWSNGRVFRTFGAKRKVKL
jgi:PAS domain S-box-containing protein